MIESWASAKSFRPKEEPPQDSNDFKPSNPDVDFHGQKRTNETHASTTDPEARLYRKGPGKEAKLSHMGHALTENRQGLILGITASAANGTAEREATEQMLDGYASGTDWFRRLWEPTKATTTGRFSRSWKIEKLCRTFRW